LQVILHTAGLIPWFLAAAGALMTTADLQFALADALADALAELLADQMHCFG